MRQLAKAGFALLFSTLAVSVWGTAALIPIVLLLVIALVAFLRRSSKYPDLFFIAIAAVAGFFSFQLYTVRQYQPAMELHNTQAQVSAQVVDISTSSSGWITYELDTWTMDEAGDIRRAGAKMYLRERLDVDYYDVLIMDGTYTKQRELFEVTLGDYNKSTGYYLVFTMEEIRSVERPEVRPLSYYFRALRDHMEAILERVFEEEDAAMMKGVLLGNTGDIADSIKTDFRRAGLSHLFAVSGLHLTIISQFFMQLCQFFRINRRKTGLIGSVFILAFMLLTGCSVSVVRAGIMQLFCLSGNVVDRQGKGLNSLGLAVLVMLLWRPYIIFSTGFLLSVTATLGILLFTAPLTGKLTKLLHVQYRVLEGIIETFAVSIGACLGMLPVMMLNYSELSWISIIANPILNIFISVILIGGFLVTLIGAVPFLFPIASFCGTMVEKALVVMRYAAHWFATLPFGNSPVAFPWVPYWVIFALALVLLGAALKRYRAVGRILALVILFSFLAGMAVTKQVQSTTTQISILHNRSYSAQIITSGGQTVVYGCGGSTYMYSDVETYLRGIGIYRVDLWVQTGSSLKEMERTADFSNRFPLGTLIVAEAMQEQAFLELSGTCSDLIVLGDGVDLETNKLSLSIRPDWCFIETDFGSVLLGQGGEISTADIWVAELESDADASGISAEQVALLAPTDGMNGYDNWFDTSQHAECCFLLDGERILHIV